MTTATGLPGVDQMVSEPIGPDYTRSPVDDPNDSQIYESDPTPKRTNPIQDVLDKARTSAKNGADNLGRNKKRASGIRALNQRDRDKIAGAYRIMAGGLMMIRPQASELMALSAEDCADTWMRWAEENDAIRRWLLGFLEGSAIMGVIMVHVPIALAFVPDSAWEKLPPIMHAMHPDILIQLKKAQQDKGDNA